MSHWIKRWLDWAMRDLWPMYRLGPSRPEALHYSYEKAGLMVLDQPIPWNAEAVYVEALMRLPAHAESPRRARWSKRQRGDRTDLVRGHR